MFALLTIERVHVLGVVGVEALLGQRKLLLRIGSGPRVGPRILGLRVLGLSVLGLRVLSLMVLSLRVLGLSILGLRILEIR